MSGHILKSTRVTNRVWNRRCRTPSLLVQEGVSMLKPAVIREIHQGQITKQQGHLVVATRFYPRFLPRAGVHEYISDLALLMETIEY